MHGGFHICLDETTGDVLADILAADAAANTADRVFQYFIGIVADVKGRGVLPMSVYAVVGPAVYHPLQLIHLQPDFVRHAMAITAVWQATGHKVRMTKAEPVSPPRALPPPDTVAVYETRTGEELGVYVF